MEKLLCVTVILILCMYSVSYGSDNIEITSVGDGIVENNQSVTFHGVGFGIRSNNGGEEDYLCRKWDNFEDQDFSGWNFNGGNSVDWSIVSSNNRTNSSYATLKTIDTGSGLYWKGHNPPGNISTFYTSFWFRMPSNYPSANGNNKIFRAGSQDNGANLVWGNFFNNQSKTTLEFASGGTEVVNGATLALSEWMFIEIEWALPVGQTDNYAKVYINGVIDADMSNVWNSGYLSSAPYMWYGAWVNTSHGIGDGWQFDDIYIDYTRARVMIGNNSTFQNCTHREMQIPTAWNEGSITVNFNAGSFSEGDTVYLYAIDADGNISNNGQGVEIIIGEQRGEGNDQFPSIGFTAPTSGSSYVEEIDNDQKLFNISGTASDDNGIQSVTFSTDNGQSGDATSANGYTTWSLPVTVNKNETVVTTITVTDTNNQSTHRTMTIACTSPIGWDANQQIGDSTWTDSGVTYCVRLLMEGDSVTDDASQVILGFQGRSSGNYTIRNVSIAQRDTVGNEGDVIDSTWTQVTFDGAAWNNGVIVGSGSEKISDPVSIQLKSGTDYYVTFKIDSPSVYLDPPSGYRELYFSSADHTSDVDWGGNGYSVTQDYHALSKIYIHAADSLSAPSGFQLSMQ